jgi:lactate dehydrogenase-like 2-hydroxyacid dehydrogenase
MKPSVFVSRLIPEAGLALVREDCEATIWPGEMPPPYESLRKQAQGKAGILCTLTERIDAALIEAIGPQLKVISTMAVGHDNIDIRAAQARGIAVGNTPGVLTDATADIAMALLLATARRLVESLEYIRSGQWQTWQPTALLGTDLAGATVGIVGLGRIGKAVARRARGFDLRLIAHSPTCPPEDAAVLGVELVSMEQLLRESDFVSLHVPLNPQTRHLINRQTLAQMKPSAILINTTRGGVVDQAALFEALQAGRLRGAGLDVTDPEPIPLSDPLLTLPNVIILPHIGSASQRTRDRMAVMAAQNLIAGVTGQPLPNQVV